jgi:L-threonylcarbamoyladenylate synthase
MKEFHLHPENLVENRLVQEVVDRLLVGEIGIIPTETVYGLMCTAENQSGRERIYDIKKRDTGRPLQFLIGSIADLMMLNMEPSQELLQLADKFWPGPLTIIAPDVDHRDIGVRIPHHPFVLAVLNSLKKPLLATSANRSGIDPVISARSRFLDLIGLPDFCVFNNEMKGIASTVIKLNGSTFEILRSGPITTHDLETALRIL